MSENVRRGYSAFIPSDCKKAENCLSVAEYPLNECFDDVATM